MFALFERLVEAFPDEEPERPPTRMVPFLWHYARPVWPYLLAMSGLTAIISVLEVYLFSFLSSLVDLLGTSSPENLLVEHGPLLLAMAVLVLLVLPLTGTLQALLLHQTLIGNFPMRVRWKMHRYLLGQSYSFYQDEFAGRVATKVMQSSLAVRETVMKLLDVMVYVVTFFVGTMILVGSFSPWLLVPFLLWLVGYVAMLRYFLPKMREISTRQADARSDMTGRVVDSYTNIMTVKLFAHTGREAGYARKSMGGFLDTVYPQFRIVTLVSICLDILNALLLFGVAVVAVGGWMSGASSVGAVAASIGLVLRMTGMSQWIVWELSGLFENIGTVQDGINTVARDRDVPDVPNAPALEVPAGRIEFENLSFHYGKAGGVIENLSLNLAPGEKVGLVGRSGAGKTTLTNLLLRLYDLEGGRILIDGQDISQVRQESLRRHIGVVTQDTSLLHRSIFDNIAYGRPDATLEEVISAATRANAHEFIGELSDTQGRTGYEAHVGERGVKLSGGQRQRVAIARMFLKNSPILVLDEATSALDSEVEAAIQENLEALMHGKTVIAIAHRLSTIMALDRLVVMQDGQIVEQGNHQELAESDGLYAQLWRRQSGGFLTDEATATQANPLSVA